MCIYTKVLSCDKCITYLSCSKFSTRCINFNKYIVSCLYDGQCIDIPLYLIFSHADYLLNHYRSPTGHFHVRACTCRVRMNDLRRDLPIYSNSLYCNPINQNNPQRN